MDKKTIIQYYEWYQEADGQHWKRIAEDAPHLAELGFTDAWLPPAYKGYGGAKDVGYAVYDLYDLGEFDQKDTVATKYGTKDEYLEAIRVLKENGIRTMADIVLNHRLGADRTEDTFGTKIDKEDRNNKLKFNKSLRVWTAFDFPGRDGQYSTFRWNKDHFSSVDFNALTGSSDYIFKLNDHFFARKVSGEFGNYDHLMGANVDFSRKEVVDELYRWGSWYLDFTGVESLRLDALKHITYDFYPGWLQMLREHTGRELFTVGEYWVGNLGELMAYLRNCGRCMSLFDVPLHFNFQHLSLAGSKACLADVLNHTLVSQDPDHAVTFVDNHDTQYDRELQSWVQGWFKPLAYAIILLREKGTPCVFYGDLYGVPSYRIAPVQGLETLLRARKEYGYGHQEDYFYFNNVIGWTRGDHMAVVLSNGDDGWMDMYLGKPGDVFVDLMGNRKEEVVIDQNGCGTFLVRSHSVSVWVRK